MRLNDITAGGRRRRGLDVAALYAAHRERLLAFFVRRTADTEIALDLWAETFAQAVANRHRFRGGTDDESAAWLYGIAQRQLAAYLRRGYAEKRAMQRLGLERPPLDPELEAELERVADLAELRRTVGGALTTLSHETRSAVELRIVRELPYAEIASRLAISEQAARARVSRGLRALAVVLESACNPEEVAIP